MPFKPEALDYEGVFPPRKHRRSESDAQTEVWPRSENFNSFENPSASNAETSTAPVTTGNWIRRRGHTLTFVALFLFSFILYVRPYEFFPALSSFMSMAFYTGIATLIIFAISQLSVEGNLTARPKEINLVLLLTVAALLSMPLAVEPQLAWTTFTELLLKMVVIFIVLVNVVRTELRLKLLLLFVLAVSVYLSVNAINDYRLGIFGIGELGTQRVAGRIKGLFENSNDLALHLVTMIPIAAALGLSGRNPLKKLLYFGITALMVGAVTVTFSRGGFIGLVAATFVLVRRLGKKNRVATIGALVFAVILFAAMAPGAFSSRISTIFNSAADLTGSASQRTEVLKRSIWVSLRYPIFGVGMGNFVHKSPRNLVTHNSYTQVSAEMGLAAMVVYILFQVYPLRRLRRIEEESRSHPDRRKFYYLSIGLQASLVGYMVSSFFGAVAYQWYVYYLVGYAVCLHRIFLIKHGPDNLARELWENPFAKKRQQKLVPETTAS